MATKLNPATVAGVIVGVLAVVAYPAWRWFAAPAVDREVLPAARPFRGTVLEPVSLELRANPKTPSTGRTVGGVTFFPDFTRFVPFTDRERKAMKAEIDDHLRGQGVPMDAPTMAKGAAANGIFLRADVSARADVTELVSIDVRVSASKQLLIRGESTDAVNAVLHQESRSGRAGVRDVKKAIVVLTNEAVDGVVARWRTENGK